MWFNENECSDEELVLFIFNSDCVSCDAFENYNKEFMIDVKLNTNDLFIFYKCHQILQLL